MKILLIVVLMISIVSMSFSQTPSKSTPEKFPLKKGNYWVYEGQASSKKSPNYKLHPNADNNPNRKVIVAGAKKKMFTWKVEVVETYEHKNIKVAILKNDFSNVFSIIRGEKENPNKPTVIICINNNLIYSIEDERVEKIIKRVKKENFSISDLLTKDDLILLLPLKVNTYFGREDDTANGTGSFERDNQPGWCWTTNKQKPINPTKINFLAATPDLNISQPIKEYELSWNANNGFTTKMFVNGVGFTSYRNVYHGPALYEEYDLKLVECNLEK